MASYFNPRAPCGARQLIADGVNTLGQFQSTRPVRGATNMRVNIRFSTSISIHAPRAGRDPGPEVLHYGRWISIHAPRAGRDHTVSLHCWRWRNFNPRAPCGARRSPAMRILRTTSFQSTRPVRGATHERSDPHAGAGISIHAPRAGRDHHRAAFRPDADISIHAPRAGRDHFQSCKLYRVSISIHAPRAGRDLARASHSLMTLLFQSTRPVRGATINLGNVNPSGHDFNPRAPCGARLWYCWRGGFPH